MKVYAISNGTKWWSWKTGKWGAFRASCIWLGRPSAFAERCGGAIIEMTIDEPDLLTEEMVLARLKTEVRDCEWKVYLREDYQGYVSVGINLARGVSRGHLQAKDPEHAMRVIDVWLGEAEDDV